MAGNGQGAAGVRGECGFPGMRGAMHGRGRDAGLRASWLGPERVLTGFGEKVWGTFEDGFGNGAGTKGR